MPFVFAASDHRLNRSDRIILACLLWHRASDISRRHKRLAKINDDLDERIKHGLAPWRLATGE
jgi:hypothetical protein